LKTATRQRKRKRSIVASIFRTIFIVIAIVIPLAIVVTLVSYAYVSNVGGAQVVDVPVTTYADITNPASTGGPTTAELKKLPHADYAVIPGAAVWGTSPSPVLKERIEMGLRLYKAGVVSQLFLSGAIETANNNASETAQMRAYLVANGVPTKAMVIDNAGVDTYASLVRARDYYGPNKRMYFITEPAYANRAGFVLHGLGCNGQVLGSDIYHLAVQYDDAVHEYLAATKAMAQILLGIHENVATIGQSPVLAVQ
jgi:vancomycin permeability regulator SanA